MQLHLNAVKASTSAPVIKSFKAAQPKTGEDLADYEAALATRDTVRNIADLMAKIDQHPRFDKNSAQGKVELDQSAMSEFSRNDNPEFGELRGFHGVAQVDHSDSSSPRTFFVDISNQDAFWTRTDAKSYQTQTFEDGRKLYVSPDQRPGAAPNSVMVVAETQDGVLFMTSWLGDGSPIPAEFEDLGRDLEPVLFEAALNTKPVTERSTSLQWREAVLIAVEPRS